MNKPAEPLQKCKRPCTNCILNFWNDADTCIIDHPSFALRIAKSEELYQSYVNDHEFKVPPASDWHIFDESAARIHECPMHKTYDEYEKWCSNG